MTWNYRILKDETGCLALHEVFYDKAGNPKAYGENPTTFVAVDREDPKAIEEGLQMALQDAKKYPILDKKIFKM